MSLLESLKPASEKAALERAIGIGALVVVAIFPLAFHSFSFEAYWVSFILTQTFLMGIAAASLIFLSAYGGMISLAQAALYGIAAFSLGNMVTKGSVKGLHLGLNPWLAVLLAIVTTTAIGFVFGAVASRSTGIYFLMITLTYAVIAFYFFGQVTQVSGFSGIGGIQDYTPGFVGNPVTQPNRLYYIALVTALLVYLAIRYVVRTPFGIAFQGVRDDPIRMGSLGYNVALHRTLAFTFAAFVASLAGVLFGWWNDVVAPGNVGLAPSVDLLIIAVIGGLSRVEGAWLGAFAFIVINNYVRDVSVPVLGGSFNTVIGLIFLAIVIVSPNGLIGLWDRLLQTLLRDRGGGSPEAPAEVQTATPGAGSG
jgi:branched-chain amino acid transport system permease protein